MEMAMANRSKARHRLSILDMSVEDDALIPLPCLEESQENAEAATQSTGNSSLGEDDQEPNLVEPLIPTRKKTSRSKLRQSLAWDKAFLTGEGVLDADELPIARRSPPKKLPEIPVFEVNTRLHSGSSANGSTGEARLESTSVRTSADTMPSIQESREVSATNLRSRSERFDASRWQDKGSLHPGLQKSASQKSTFSFVPRPAPAKKAIESAIQKGTKLRLPSSVPRAEQMRIAVPLPPEQEKTLTSKVSSMSRKVKDTLGRVLPGRSPKTSKTSSPVGASLQRPTERSGENADETAMGHGRSNSKQEPHASRSSTMNTTKPTGLKIPSPKLGFFDPGSAKLGGGLSGHSMRVPSQQSLKSKPHGLPRARPVHDQRPGDKDACQLASAPSTPRTAHNDLLSPSTRSALFNTVTTPKGKHGGIPAARSGSKSSRRLGLEEVTSKGNKMDEPSSLLKLSEDQENCKPNGSEVSSLKSKKPTALKVEAPRLSSARVQDGGARSPLSVNHELTNMDAEAVQEQKENTAAKVPVHRISPVHDSSNSLEQENQAPDTKPWADVEPDEPQSSCCTENGGNIVKTGPVQHSPPIKPILEANPWSPVKKNLGQELGPFDCTKLNARAVDWD